jgi:hypothetical protein
MATEELSCVMEASKSDGTSGSYYVYRKGSDYSIVSPSNYRHSCRSSVANIEDVKTEIMVVFNATVTKVTPRALLGK